VEDSKLISVLQQDWAPFECCKVHNPKVIWADHSLLTDNNPESITSFHKNLIQENAYVIKDTPSFADLKLDPSDTKTLMAERYGGLGIGKNGGGGRCGNSEKYQLKGIGANCMVGDHDDEIHKYGGLDAPLAIIETIYTYLLSSVLPLGAVRIHGLVLIGKESGIYHHPANKCWGVIMLRDNCLRPAHFMRAPFFESCCEYRSMLIDDVARVRKINRELYRIFKGANGFIHYLGRFLRNCANQFGFARAARIMHGTLSPSNIAIDGKWLDVHMASFVSGGINQGYCSDFYSEHSAPLEYATEILHGFAKYNRLSLSPKPLANYYAEQFDAYFERYIGFTLGILRFVDRLDSIKWNSLTTEFDLVIHRCQSITTRVIVASNDDPVHALTAAFFLSFYSPKVAQLFLSSAKISELDSQRIVEKSSDIMNEIWQLHHGSHQAKFPYQDHFFVGTALVALKRAYLSTVFYSPLVERNVWGMCQAKHPDDVAPLINNYIELIDWIYEASYKQVTLYQSNELKIIYRQSDGTYRLESSDDLLTYSCYQELFQCLNTIDKEKFVVNNFNFFDFFNKLERVIPLMHSSDRKI